MDRDNAPLIIERDVGPAAPTVIDFEKLSISAQDAMLIAASWGALMFFQLV